MTTINRNRGFVLIFTLSTVLLVALIGITYAFVAINDLRMADKITDGDRAFYIAEAGIAKKFEEIRTATPNLNSISNETFALASGNTGTFSVNVVTLSSVGAFSRYRLESTGTYQGVQKQVDFTIRQIPVSRYAYLSNSEAQMFWWGERPIWFITRDTLRGPIYTNDQLNISGDPTFDGPVSSHDNSINYYHGGPPNDNPNFLGTLTLGAPIIQLPTITDTITPIKTAAQTADGLYLTGNSVITLVADGTMNVTNSNKGWTNHNVPLPANHSVFVSNGYADVSGTLNGQLTIGTNRNIYVVNNILYHADPRTDPTSNDMLGLVSQNNVYVDAAAPYNVEIDAYVVALNSSFTVENYAAALKGTLTVFGGMTQVIRGPVGTFNPRINEKVSGYTKDYNYDDRLSDSSPPYFQPAKDNNGRIVYAKVSWVEH